VPSVVVSLAVAFDASLPLIPTWPGIQAKVILNAHLESE
jgi:hypothetical protein